jgi:hypothetical protein
MMNISPDSAGHITTGCCIVGNATTHTSCLNGGKVVKPLPKKAYLPHNKETNAGFRQESPLPQNIVSLFYPNYW